MQDFRARPRVSDAPAAQRSRNPRNPRTNRTLCEVKESAQSAVAGAPHADEIYVDSWRMTSAGRWLLLQHLDQRFAEPRGRRRDFDPRLLHRSDLRFGVALATRDDRAGVSHATAGRRRAPRDEADHRLLAAALGLVLEKLRGVLLGAAADLADHDDRLGRLVGKQHLQHFNEFGAFHRIAADADRGGLAEPFA